MDSGCKICSCFNCKKRKSTKKNEAKCNTCSMCIKHGLFSSSKDCLK